MTTKIRILLPLMGVVAGLGISASPAAARFTNTEGKVEQTGTNNVFKYIVGGVTQAEVKCEKAGGTWKDPETPNKLAIFGSITWAGCVGTHGTTKETVVVECKGLTLKQPNTEGTAEGNALASVTETCLIKAAATCTITVEPTNNKDLAEVHLLKEAGPQVLAKANVTGISAKSSAACQLVGISASTTTATLVGEFIQHGQGLE